MKKSLKNNLCWVIGASEGIGKALVQELLNTGAQCIISARNTPKLEKMATGQETSVFPVTLDLENEVSIEHAIARVLEIGIPQHVFLVGGISQRSHFLESDLATGYRLFECNFWGHVKVTHGILPHMLTLSQSGLVEISSIVGKFGYHRRSFYSASKHAVKGFFESIALEYHHKGLHVCLAYPGKINTDIALRALKGDGQTWNEKESAHEQAISAKSCAQIILKDYTNGKKTSYPGGKEMLSLRLQRFFPKLLFKILLKQNKL